MFEYLQNRKGHRGIPAHRVLSGSMFLQYQLPLFPYQPCGL